MQNSAMYSSISLATSSKTPTGGTARPGPDGPDGPEISTKHNIEKDHSLHNCQGIPSYSRYDRCKCSNAHQSKLEERVILADGRGVDLCRGKREIPISHERLWWRQGDPSVVDGRETKANISTENDGS